MCTSNPSPLNLDALLDQYARDHDPVVRDRIVEENLYIARIVARKFSGRGVEYDDLFQIASLALVKAVERFDRAKNVKFVTFVTPSMAGEVKNYFRDRSRAIRLPRRGVNLAQTLRGARERLEQDLGRSPRVDELAESLRISEDEVVEALVLGSAMTVTSLDAQICDDEESSPLSEFLGVSDSGYADFERGDMLARAMDCLDDRQRAVIRGRFFENRSQREVAKQMNLSQMTVSRLERQALALLRQQINQE